jgi:putative peptide zinc metalloprotease protein
MAPWRRWLFVLYAIASWVYRWVIMFSILWMLSDFLGPKLKILSQMLALLCLASMFVWPTYRVIKNIRQRGRLPDMKATRVYTTFALLGAFLVAFFLLPLPVSRVRETGLIVIDYSSVQAVTLEEPARLLVAEVRRSGRYSAGSAARIWSWRSPGSPRPAAGWS